MPSSRVLNITRAGCCRFAGYQLQESIGISETDEYPIHVDLIQGVLSPSNGSSAPLVVVFSLHAVFLLNTSHSEPPPRLKSRPVPTAVIVFDMFKEKKKIDILGVLSRRAGKKTLPCGIPVSHGEHSSYVMGKLRSKTAAGSTSHQSSSNPMDYDDCAARP